MGMLGADDGTKTVSLKKKEKKRKHFEFQIFIAIFGFSMKNSFK